MLLSHASRAAASCVRVRGFCTSPSASLGKHSGVLARLREQIGSEGAAGWRKLLPKHVAQMEGGRQLLQEEPETLATVIVEHCRETEERGGEEGGRAAREDSVTEDDVVSLFGSEYWLVKSNREKFVRRFAAFHSISSPTEWRSVSSADISAFGGAALLRVARKLQKEEEERGGETAGGVADPVFFLLRESYPEWNLLAPECRGKIPVSYWQEGSGRMRQLMERLAEVHGVTEAADWAKVTTQNLKDIGGGSILRHYGSFYAALVALFPEMRFDERTCRPKHRQGYWSERENRVRLFEEVREKLKMNEMADWKAVGIEEVREAGGGPLITHYGGIFAMLADLSGEEALNAADCRPQQPLGHWKKAENRRAFMDEVAKKMGVTTAEEWQKVSLKDMKEMGGTGLLYSYRDSLYDLLADVYGEDFVTRDCRPRVRPSYWEEKANRRQFMDEVKEKYGIEETGGWSRVTDTDVREMGGFGCLAYYKGSLTAAIADVYGLEDSLAGSVAEEEGEVEREEFLALLCRPRVPTEFWNKKQNIVQFMRYLEGRLDIKEPQDWFRVSSEELHASKAAGLLRKMSLADALRLAFPNVSWDAHKLDMPKKAHQRQLRSQVWRIFAREQPADALMQQ